MASKTKSFKRLLERKTTLPPTAVRVSGELAGTGGERSSTRFSWGWIRSSRMRNPNSKCEGKNSNGLRCGTLWSPCRRDWRQRNPFWCKLNCSCAAMLVRSRSSRGEEVLMFNAKYK